MEKIALFEEFWSAYQEGSIDYAPSNIKIFSHPSYGAFCTIVPPRNVPLRKRMSTLEGRQLFLHAIMHIEYSAIDLALDAAYRFRNLPSDFYHDWLSVAADEIRHFLLLNEIANTWGFKYGDFAVHSGLFEAGVVTAHSLLERMAIVPRFMEANGLDANPKFKEKLYPFRTIEGVEKLLLALDVILHDEIDHVSKGSKWLNYALSLPEHNPLSQDYFQILEHFFHAKVPKGAPINIQARKQAGFSCAEIIHLGAQKCD